MGGGKSGESPALSRSGNWGRKPLGVADLNLRWRDTPLALSGAGKARRVGRTRSPKTDPSALSVRRLAVWATTPVTSA